MPVKTNGARQIRARSLSGFRDVHAATARRIGKYGDVLAVMRDTNAATMGMGASALLISFPYSEKKFHTEGPEESEETPSGTSGPSV